MEVLLFATVVLIVQSAQAGTVWVEFETFQPRPVETGSHFMYVTSYGNYSFDKVTGAYQYVYRNGTLLAPSVRFILQELAGESWEDLDFYMPVFMEKTDHYLQWRQHLVNNSLGYVVINAMFAESQPPKLSFRYDKPASAKLTFRVLFKVTVPQGWQYFLDEYDQAKPIPVSSHKSLTTKRVKVIESPENSVLRLLVDWEDYGETTVQLKGSTVTVVFPENEAYIDPTVVGTTTTFTATRYLSQEKLFDAQNLYWLFYCNGSHIVFKTSSDGSTWNSQTSLATANDGAFFSAWMNNTHIQYARAEAQSIKYRMGRVFSNSTILWLSDETEAVPSVNGWTILENIVIDSNGYGWISYKQGNISSLKVFVTKNQLNNGSWQNDSGFPYQLNSENQTHWTIQAVPLTNGKIYMVYQKCLSWLKGQLWNGSAWESEETISSVSYNNLNAVGDGDDVHIVYKKQTADSYYLVYKKRTNGTGWSSDLTLDANIDKNSEARISHDGTNIFVFYRHTDVFYFRGYVGGQWHPRFPWIVDITYCAQTMTTIKDKNKAMAWTNQLGSPASVYFDKFVHSQSVGDFTIWNINNDFPVYDASWNDIEKKLSFLSGGDIVIETASYGVPYQVYDGQSFVSWTTSGTNISFTAQGSDIWISWKFPTEEEGHRRSQTPVEEEAEEEEAEPEEGVKLPTLGLYGLVFCVVIVVVGGVLASTGKSKVVRKPSGSSKSRLKKPKGIGKRRKLK